MCVNSINVTQKDTIITAQKCVVAVYSQQSRKEAENFCSSRLNASLADGQIIFKNESYFRKALEGKTPGQVWITKERIIDKPGYMREPFNVIMENKRNTSVEFSGRPRFNNIHGNLDICGDTINMAAARVICREFGLEAEAVEAERYHYRREMHDVNCDGSENYVFECNIRRQHCIKVAHVKCKKPAPPIDGFQRGIYFIPRRYSSTLKSIESDQNDWNYFLCQLNNEASVSVEEL